MNTRARAAKPVKRTPPSYPRAELVRNQQGWVQLSYVVTPEGEVIDPVVEDSSGSRLFERAALRTVRQWSYEPATWDEQPVQQCQTKVMITFALEDVGKKVSRKFANRNKKIDKLIANGELDKAGKMIDDTFENFELTLPELAWLWAQRAYHAGLVGDKEAQLHAVRKATASNGRWVDDDLYPRLLLVRTTLELENGNFSEALSAHEKLVATGAELPHIDKLQSIVDSVVAAVESDTLLSVPGKIESADDCDDCVTKWRYRPLRRRFSLTEVNGELQDLELRCSWQRIVDKAREGKAWEIPEDWGNCSIIVFGEPGSTFKLLEEPSA